MRDQKVGNGGLAIRNNLDKDGEANLEEPCGQLLVRALLIGPAPAPLCTDGPSHAVP
jgi:hypothetical protein